MPLFKAFLIFDCLLILFYLAFDAPKIFYLQHRIAWDLNSQGDRQGAQQRLVHLLSFPEKGIAPFMELFKNYYQDDPLLFQPAWQSFLERSLPTLADQLVGEDRLLIDTIGRAMVDRPHHQAWRRIFLKHPDGEIRALGLWLLRQNSQSLDGLLTWLQDPAPVVREEAIRSLAISDLDPGLWLAIGLDDRSPIVVNTTLKMIRRHQQALSSQQVLSLFARQDDRIYPSLFIYLAATHQNWQVEVWEQMAMVIRALPFHSPDSNLNDDQIQVLLTGMQVLAEVDYQPIAEHLLDRFQKEGSGLRDQAFDGLIALKNPIVLPLMADWYRSLLDSDQRAKLRILDYLAVLDQVDSHSLLSLMADDHHAEISKRAQSILEK